MGEPDRLHTSELITLREVTQDNISAVEQLRVRAGQEMFVDDVVRSLAEAKSNQLQGLGIGLSTRTRPRWAS